MDEYQIMRRSLTRTECSMHRRIYWRFANPVGRLNGVVSNRAGKNECYEIFRAKICVCVPKNRRR